MENKVIKKTIVLILIMLLVIVVGMIMVLKFYSKNNSEIYIDEGSPGTNTYECYGKAANGKVDYIAYFDIKKYMQKYLDTINIKNLQYGYYNENGEFVPTVNENQIKQKIYNLLSNKYINEKNITVDNIYNHIGVLQNSAIFVPVEMSLIQDGEIKSFIVHGIIESAIDYKVMDNLFAIINIDIHGYKFSIEPIKGQYNSVSEIIIDKMENTIIENEDNKFFQEYIEIKDIPSEYIELYKGLALGAPEKLYELLDEEYKNTKFGNIEEFKKYIQKNKGKIITAKLEKYQGKVDGTKVRYVCIDNNGNYYVINQNQALADYKMMLDTYTLDLSEFIEKYDSSEDNIKVALNIEKLIEATRYGDYRYVYNKLDDTFKSSNFKTQDDFERYIKERYNPEEDEIEYKSYETIAGLHVYNIEVTDKSEGKTIEAKVVMQLKDERNFVFSFSEKN